MENNRKALLFIYYYYHHYFNLIVTFDTNLRICEEIKIFQCQYCFYQWYLNREAVENFLFRHSAYCFMYHTFFFFSSALLVLDSVRPVVAFKQFQGVVNHELNFHKYCRWRTGKIKMSTKANTCEHIHLKSLSIPVLPVWCQPYWLLGYHSIVFSPMIV